ncbi:MAG: hypothetical protein V1800_09555 [Candidatus Latescibacterota bacterium]
MVFLKRQFPLVICFVTGVVFAVQYYVPHSKSEALLTNVNNWMIIIGGFAMILGLTSLSHVHAMKIRRKSAGWGYSAVVFLTIIGTLVAGIISQGRSLTEETLLPTSFGWLYEYMMVPLQGTVFALLAFYMASAAFRTFQARTLEGAFLFVAALIVMFGHVPLGEILWAKIFGQGTMFQIGDVMGWVMNVPNMAAKRGIWLGVALGTIATSLKIIFGIERAYLGGKE